MASSNAYGGGSDGDAAVGEEAAAVPLLPRAMGARRLGIDLPGMATGHRRTGSADLREDVFSFHLEAPEHSLARSGMADSVSPALSITSSSVPMKKRLSETRNVKLPNIVMPSGGKESTVSAPGRLASSGGRSYTPPLTESPIGHSLHQMSETVPRSAADLSVIDLRIYFSNTHVDLEGNESGSSPRFTAIELKVEGGKVAPADFLLELLAMEYGIETDLAEEALALWMESPLLEVQLKAHHSPWEIRRAWSTLLSKFAGATEEEKLDDVPTLVVRRKVQLPLQREQQIIEKCELVREILFNDAHDAFMSGRYPLDPMEAARLAGLAMAVTFEPYSKEKHSLEFIRRELDHFVPAHLLSVIRGPLFFGKAIASMNNLEECLVSSWARASGNRAAVHLDFLSSLHTLPFYGAAFFQGSIERLKKKKWLLQNADIRVLVGVTQTHVAVIDESKHELLLVQKIDECSWKRIDLDERQLAEGGEPSLLLHFPDDGGEEKKGRGKLKEKETPPTNTKMLQIFGRAVVMVDALLSAMLLLLEEEEEEAEEVDSGHEGGHFSASDRGIAIPGPVSSASSTSSPSSSPPDRAVCRMPSLTRHSKLCLATFDPHGRCVEAHGSLKAVLQRNPTATIQSAA